MDDICGDECRRILNPKQSGTYTLRRSASRGVLGDSYAFLLVLSSLD